MNRVFTNLLLFCLISSARAIPALRYRIEQINEYLVSKVDSDDALPNYAAANLYLERIAKTGEQELIDALRLFIATRTLIDDIFCNSSSKLIAQEACESIGSCSSVINLPHVNRASRMILQSVRSHARSCESIYPKRYAALIGNLNNIADRVDVIGTALGTLISASNGYDDLNQVFCGDADRALKVVRGTYRLLFDKNLIKTLIELIAKPDPLDLVKILGPIHGCVGNVPIDKVDELYDTWLLKPCDQHNTLLKKEVFDLSDFDFVVRDEHNLNDDYSMKHFYPGWLRYGICEQVIRSRNNWIYSIKNHLEKTTC